MKNLWNFRPANFKPFLSFPIAFLALLAILFSLQSCRKDITSLGLDLKDDLLNATFTDTITVIAHSVKEDTLNTKNLIYHYLGTIKDPVFGTTTTGIYTQFLPSGSSANFGKSPQLDSIVLTLRYAGGYYGDTLNPFVVQVHRLTEDMYADTATKYFQNSYVAHSSENLTYIPDFKLYPKPTTKIKVDTLREAHIRIRLKDELGNLFLGNTSEIASETKFLNFFKGLYICAKPLSNDGSMVNITLTSSITAMQLYYTNDSTSTSFSFLVKEIGATRFSSYQHDYLYSNDNDFKNQVLQGDTMLGKNTLYLQAMGGVKTKITFPFLKAFEGRNIIINKAELVITNKSEESMQYKAPNRLGLQGLDKDGKAIFIPDDAVYMNTAYFGGAAQDNEYRFRITRYLQEMILPENEKRFQFLQPSLYLITDRAAADPYRMCFYGTDLSHPSRLRLEIYYTEY